MTRIKKLSNIAAGLAGGLLAGYAILAAIFAFVERSDGPALVLYFGAIVFGALAGLVFAAIPRFHATARAAALGFALANIAAGAYFVYALSHIDFAA